MKRKIILGSILTIASFVFVACSSDNDTVDSDKELYVAIPDSSFEAELIEQGIDSDGIMNQRIKKADAEKVVRLDLNLSANFGDISDLTGIESFVNLKFLSAGNHDLESVDLSANTLLDSIYLLGNKISNIDFSNNTNLIFVDLQSNSFSSSNSISGLENALNLKDLDVSWNYMEEFSIHNESLEVLHMSHNDLRTIDTDGVVNLRNVLLTSNKLEAVDFSSNTLIETLLISDNKLENINLESNGKLTHLYISSNLLSDLNLSNNLDLVEIKVDRNESLTCIKINDGQYISSVSISDYQELSSTCD